MITITITDKGEQSEKEFKDIKAAKEYVDGLDKSAFEATGDSDFKVNGFTGEDANLLADHINKIRS